MDGKIGNGWRHYHLGKMWSPMATWEDGRMVGESYEILGNDGNWWDIREIRGNEKRSPGKKIRGEMSTKKWTGNTSIREGNEGHEMKWVYIFKYFKYTMDLKRDHSMGIFSFGKSASEMDVSWIVMVCLKTLGVKHPDYIKLGPPGKMDRLNLYRQPPNRSRCWKIGGGPHLSSKWSPFWVKQHPDHQVLWIPRWLPVYVICRGWVSLVL